MLVARILKRVGGRISRLSLSLRNPIRVTPTRYLRVWYVRGFQFSLHLLFFAFSSSADETSFTPCLKSRIFFFSAFESRAGGTDEVLADYHLHRHHHYFPSSFTSLLSQTHRRHHIIWVLSLSNQKQLHQLSQIVCTIPHFFPSPFFPLQLSYSPHLGAFILFYPFSQFPGTRFGGMECGF